MPASLSERFPQPDLKDVPEDIRARILAVQEKAGFVPNVFLSFARRPASAKGRRSLPAKGAGQGDGGC